MLLLWTVLLSRDVSMSISKDQYTATGPLGSDALTRGQHCSDDARIKVSAILDALMRMAEQCWESRTAFSDAIGFPAQGGTGFLRHLKRTCCAV